MRLLLDTHIVLWSASSDQRISAEGLALLNMPENELWFSVVSIWEMAVKRGLGRNDFTFDPRITRQMLLANGFLELPVTGEHALAVQILPRLHKDPFDRILIAQAHSEGMRLLTADGMVGQYPGDILKV